MSLQFQLAYLFGYRPWDRWQGKALPRLRAIFEGPDALPPGRALDLGCGMGRASIYLAGLGWTVTGVDMVERALRVARRRAEKAGVAVDFRQGDVTRLAEQGITGPFDLFIDLGCFHILPDRERRLYGGSIARVAMPEAKLLMFAFGPNKLVWGPRGATRADIECDLAPNWAITWSAPETDLPYRIPRGASATWYMLKRQAPR